jgi:formylglycine-generating enzyme required for sulfatase activity
MSAKESSEPPCPPSSDALIEASVGQYRIVRQVGRGGMGVVYEAIHREIGQRAAVKVLAPRAAHDPQYISRFFNEARAVSRVTHPGLVKIFDFGKLDDGTPFILMEFLDGQRLRDRLKQLAAGLDVLEALRISRQVASALAGAHAQGIVHRDLKPENVMLVPDDAAPGGVRARLLDFGIAKLMTESTNVTEPGVVVGTATYMSPEQCGGEDEIDGAADVYSLGVLLFELLAGTPPFSAKAPAAIMRQHLFAELPSLAERAPTVPHEVAQLVHSMLAKEPTMRPSINQVVERLRYLEEHSFNAAPMSSTAHSTRILLPLWLLGSLALVTAGVVGGRALWLRRHAKPPAVLTNMVFLKGGHFRMGRTPEAIEAECKRLGSDCWRPQMERQQPMHEVVLSPFYMDAHEVTNQEFALWLDTEARTLRMQEDKEWHLLRYVKDQDGTELADLFPTMGGIEKKTENGPFTVRSGFARKAVVQVTWDGASRYCNANGKRLPTEAEWEFAARGTTARRYPWGDDDPRCDSVVFGHDLDKGVCGRNQIGPQEIESSSQDRTPEGIFDLGGNVSEWVQDQFLRPYYPPCGDCVDPKEESSVPREEDWRITRGGSWVTSRGPQHSSHRGHFKRKEASTSIGFRCVSN